MGSQHIGTFEVLGEWQDELFSVYVLKNLAKQHSVHRTVVVVVVVVEVVVVVVAAAAAGGGVVVVAAAAGGGVVASS